MVVHDDYFAQGTEDEIWLEEVGKKGWVVLTKDDNIRYHKTERESVIRTGAVVFVLPRGNLRAEKMATIFVGALPRIKRFIKSHTPPFIARLTPSGAISLLALHHGK